MTSNVVRVYTEKPSPEKVKADVMQAIRVLRNGAHIKSFSLPSDSLPDAFVNASEFSGDVTLDAGFLSRSRDIFLQFLDGENDEHFYEDVASLVDEVDINRAATWQNFLKLKDPEAPEAVEVAVMPMLCSSALVLLKMIQEDREMGFFDDNLKGSLREDLQASDVLPYGSDGPRLN